MDFDGLRIAGCRVVRWRGRLGGLQKEYDRVVPNCGKEHDDSDDSPAMDELSERFGRV